jgi:hypothetical protein
MVRIKSQNAGGVFPPDYPAVWILDLKYFNNLFRR